jgi:hypothetical protein
MTSLRAVIGGLTLALATPSPGRAVLDSNFNGWAVSGVADAPGVYTVGETYTVRLVLGDEPSGTGDGPWYPWNPLKEYTAVISSTVAAYYDAFPANPGTFWTVEFGLTTVSVYEDDGTPADFQVPSTFTDGLLILSGQTTDYSGPFNVVGASHWGFTGSVVFTSGAGLSELGCLPGAQLDFNHSISVVGQLAPGYDERYIAKFDCQGSATAVEGRTWGHVKSAYR